MVQYYTCKPAIGKRIRIAGKKDLVRLKEIGWDCKLLPNTEYTITGWDDKEGLPIVNGYTLTHRAMYTVLRNK